MTFSTIRLGFSVERIEPPFWWAGMLNPELQLMVYGKNISQLPIDIESYDGIELTRVTKLENPNYIVIDLLLDQNVKPGSFFINFKMQDETKHSYTYVLKKRRKDSSTRTVKVRLSSLSLMIQLDSQFVLFFCSVITDIL